MTEKSEKNWREMCREDVERPRKVQLASKASIVVTLPKCLRELGLAPGTLVRIYIDDIIFDEQGRIREVKLTIRVL